MYPKSGPWLLAGLLGIAAAQQSPQVQTVQAPAPNVAETVTKEEPATFKARVNLVMVPVVVRNKAGRAVGDLKQEDFLLFDKGKPQVITRFSMESSAAVKAAAGGKPKSEDPGVIAPERFIAYLFDDIHMSFADINYTREAAGRHMDTSLEPTDRAAIYTTSGQTELEFTDDREQLHATLAKLRPRPLLGTNIGNCPDLSYYQADLIQEHGDTMALRGAVEDAMICGNTTDPSVAQNIARAEASRIAAMGDQETRITIAVLRDIVRRMSGAPGQRTIVLASPGFVTPEQQQDKSEIIDRAIRARVTISSLDARGLYTDPALDVAQRTLSLAGSQIKQQYDRDAARAQSDVLAELAAGTGGSFFQNNNDLGEGYRRLASAPEYLYLLGFSPQNLKLDGSFHNLKVSLDKVKGLTRRSPQGLLRAASHLSDAEETAKRGDPRGAVFARGAARTAGRDAHAVLQADRRDRARSPCWRTWTCKNLKFRKAEGRNHDNVTIVAARVRPQRQLSHGHQQDRRDAAERRDHGAADRIPASPFAPRSM